MNSLITRQLAASAVILCGLSLTTQAGEKEDLLKLRSTTENLIKQLVKQGVLTDEAAQQMLQQAEAEVASSMPATKGSKPSENPDEVRVSYVPDFVKDEIREQVRAELRQDVVGDVLAHAKNEHWGIKDALPEWTRKFKLSGDMRLRYEPLFMANDNKGGLEVFPYYPNGQAINDAGGFSNAALDAVRNTNQDNQRFRERLRLAIDTDITESLKAGVRLSTGNLRDPVSTNQTMGQTGSRYEFSVDRAYLEYDKHDEMGFNWLTLSGGRLKNPFYVGGGEFTGGSELVWDTDLSFEGFAGTYRYNLGTQNKMGHGAKMLYATLGAFPLQEAQFSNNDKWLFAGQLGLDWGFSNNDMLRMGLAYYDYKNVTAKRNQTASGTCDLNSRENTASRPEFMQGGNTLAMICREGTFNDPVLSPYPGMVGLASDFNIVNVNMRYDMALFDPVFVTFSADYAKNLGFNSAEVTANRSLGGVLGSGSINEQTSAWQIRTDLGSLRLDKPGNWSTFIAYKYVGSDAVLDAYSDSDFHLGGTNAKGWVLGGNYALWNNVWLTSRWFSTEAVYGPSYGVDLFQMDINAKF